ncbi:uncharacterized protein LOC114408300 [Glycine soja]|uniref:uncharacterized protein n=1 Tax=Glycine max TaxID=3847 RepID=UPI0003DEBFD4|nr:uncharacterized protein LOC113001470 [Glycine max]XP_028227134.1 uncharacterized protein LOC114408300 [Glycine soja]|eukprot:XP_025984111.1 uncharacterized protein LOC113001470 [Glycine max]
MERDSLCFLHPFLTQFLAALVSSSSSWSSSFDLALIDIKSHYLEGGIYELRETIMKANTTHIIPPPVFDGDEYDLWIARMITHLEALDLWEPIEEDYTVWPLPQNPIVAQLKNHKERKIRMVKAKSMKETKTIKSYVDKLLSIANKVRLLGKDFPNERTVQKILVTVPEKYESKILALKESKDLSNITLGQLVNALQAQEQRRMMRHEEAVQGAFHIKAQNSRGDKDKKNNKWNNKKPAESSNKQQNDTFLPCPHCKKTNHYKKKCWWRPYIKCRKCGKLGHVKQICKSLEEARVSMEQQEEEQLFVATCFATSNSSNDSWLIDSSCTNHMTNDQTLFKELDKTIVSKVKIGNGDSISVKGKETVTIESLTGLKHISDVLYVPDID